MQIEISQSRQFKYLKVYVVKDAISYDCFPNHHATFCSKKMLYFKTPDGAASILSPSYYTLLKQKGERYLGAAGWQRQYMGLLLIIFLAW